jgi:PAS domain S-box-containing protein
VEGELEVRIAGETHHFYNVITPIRLDGEVCGILGLNVDITGRKRAEAALQKAHGELERRVAERTAELIRANEEIAIFHKFAEASGQGFSMADLDGRLVYLNPALCRMLGDDGPEDRIGQHLSVCYSEQSNRRGKEEIEPVLKRSGHWEGELPLLSRQGTSIPTWQNTFVIRDEDGNPLRLAVVITDITERKKAEIALEREQRALKHMLEASDRERQLIAYDIHDGLAQQLAGAIMRFQVYAHARETRPDDAAKAFDTGMAMLQQSHIETRRLISGVRPPVLDEFGVLAAIAHLVNDPAFGQEPRIGLRSKVRFRRLALPTENAIYRIVQEGLANARTHSKSKKIMVSLLQRHDRLRIEVRDWGVGFDAKATPQDRFGLEGIRQRARLLGGKCRIESKPGKGTAVIVELPLVEREPER